MFMQIFVLRIGHRPGRDKRVSTHVGLVARAFGADGIIYVGNVEKSLLDNLRKVVETWGGSFSIEVTSSYRQVITHWKGKGGVVVHLTMYGENIEGSNVLEQIKAYGKDILVVVGAEKVPADVYKLADFNVAIGNQPHSEVAALAVFLDRLYGGKELLKKFKGGRLVIIPSLRGKKVIEVVDYERKRSSTTHIGEEDPR